VFRVPLTSGGESNDVFSHRPRKEREDEEEGRPKKKRTDESFFSLSLVSSFFSPLAPKEVSFWVWGKNNVSSFSHP